MKTESVREYRRQKLQNDAPRAAGEAVLVRMASRVYALRTSLGLTQGELGARAGIDQASISDIENGDANPTLRTVGRLAAALGVEARSLLDHGSMGVKYGSTVKLNEGVRWEGKYTAASSTRSVKPFYKKSQQFKTFRSVRTKVAAE